MCPTTARSGRCAIIGKPNVGKSTLLNSLLGQKLAIATPRPQTTRTCILGVYSSASPPTQIAFVDTPGLHIPRNALGRALVEDAKGGLAGADLVVMVTEINNRTTVDNLLGSGDVQVLELLRGGAAPVVLVLNKVDLLSDKSRLLALLERCTTKHDFAAIVPMSARSKKDAARLVSELRNHLPEGLSFDPDVLTDRPERFFCAELLREALIAHTRQEVPYALAVRIDSFVDEPALSRIAATVIVEKDAHKGIVIGKGGARLKEIGTDARLEMEALLERKVFLELWVKVVPGWTNDPTKVREFTSDSQLKLEG